MEPETTPNPSPWIARRTIGAVLGGLAGAALIVGVAGAVIDDNGGTTGTAFVADTTGSTDSTTDDSTGDSTGAPTTEVILAKDAGSVTVASDGSQLRVVGTSANPGWKVEIERGTGREVEVQFENGARRIDVNAELEDGEIRARVREQRIDDDDGTTTTDDSTDATTDDSTDTTTDDTTDDSTGTTIDDHGDDDDNSGPGNAHEDDDDDDDDDNSGPGHGGDDDGRRRSFGIELRPRLITPADHPSASGPGDRHPAVGYLGQKREEGSFDRGVGVRAPPPWRPHAMGGQVEDQQELVDVAEHARRARSLAV